MQYSLRLLSQVHWIVLVAALSLAGCDDGGGAPSSVANTNATAGSALPTAGTASATVSWEAPTQNTDGTALTDLRGFKIHYGTDATELTESVTISNPGLMIYVIDALPSGVKYYFAVTAITSSEHESDRSAIVSKTVS